MKDEINVNGVDYVRKASAAVWDTFFYCMSCGKPARRGMIYTDYVNTKAYTISRCIACIKASS